MKETIYKQDAIDAIKYWWTYGAWQRLYEQVSNLPSAQSEIIRCKDCKYSQEDKMFGEYWCRGSRVKAEHFCGYAERREDGR